MSTSTEIPYQTTSHQQVKIWYKVGSTESFPDDEGICIKYKNLQIAIFNFKRKQKWYACQNSCPHHLEMVLSRGILGDDKGTPKIACPLHKNTFSLLTGENLNGNLCSISVYPVKVEDDYVYVGFIY
jgi:nitrite reductase (NADH) small subunit